MCVYISLSLYIYIYMYALVGFAYGRFCGKAALRSSPFLRCSISIFWLNSCEILVKFRCSISIFWLNSCKILMKFWSILVNFGGGPRRVRAVSGSRLDSRRFVLSSIRIV